MDSAPATATPFDDLAVFEQAVERAHTAAKAYFGGETPPMPDGDYDHLVARIAASVAVNPQWDDRGVSTAVAAGESGGAVRHEPPMLSLDKITAAAELRQFTNTLSTCTAVVEAKFDGMACHVDYRDGRLVRAVSRGDGAAGDDITHQVTREPGVAGLPVSLPHAWSGSVRGEIFMTNADFELANNARVAAGKAPFVNPRNAVAGSIRKIERTYSVPMSFAAYAISGNGLEDVDSHLERMAHARLAGITTAAMLTAGSLPAGTLTYGRRAEDLQRAVDALEKLRPRLGFPVDGAVIKADSRAVRTRMGSHSSAPRWAVAYKWAPDTAYSILREIHVSVGRTGRAGFRAVIDPVTVAGTTIRYASLHNVDWIAQQGLGVGSRVAVVRAGDVIPRVTAAAGEQPEDVVPWIPPTRCPQCDQSWERSGQLWRCTTPACSLVSLLTYAASRDVLDIDGLGEEVAAALVEADLVRDLADLYTLSSNRVAEASYLRAGTAVGRRIGAATAAKLVAGIAAAKERPLARHITSLGIRGTGRRMGRMLAQHFGTLDALRAATTNDLAVVDGIGTVTACWIRAGLHEADAVLDRLIAVGITTVHDTKPAVADGSLAGKRVVITGAIPSMTRTQAQEAAERLGATASGSVTAKTDLLIVGAGSSARSKLAKANELGVPTMSAEDFLALHAAAGTS
ncbi:NAD-dependent DNA ligase LigA [Amycolatopsis sp. WAC 01375]|uniref:NAD-dependent DNA ligase LigA n=1 Tax=Amycolatopsis sp. WAC 01375 TaxID=2203194 RepID=UPI000F78F7E1|nr:NAD-dependent DNA ligase LigA [Amycolatopsis sp. WAC 01375]RSM68942.1 NAD-dependent DNA ligase LigA [Amycolatopsis sp. WAC 01375]